MCGRSLMHGDDLKLSPAFAKPNRVGNKEILYEAKQRIRSACRVSFSSEFFARYSFTAFQLWQF